MSEKLDLILKDSRVLMDFDPARNKTASNFWDLLKTDYGNVIVFKRPSYNKKICQLLDRPRKSKLFVFVLENATGILIIHPTCPPGMLIESQDEALVEAILSDSNFYSVIINAVNKGNSPMSPRGFGASNK